MRKVKDVKVGTLVAVPYKICFPGRRDPYEYENGVVVDFGKNKKGSHLSQVIVWDHFHNKKCTKWYLTQSLYQVSYHHYVDEEKDFKSWLSKEVYNENRKVSAM